MSTALKVNNVSLVAPKASDVKSTTASAIAAPRCARAEKGARVSSLLRSNQTSALKLRAPRQTTRKAKSDSLVTCEAASVVATDSSTKTEKGNQVTVVMKFGGSSVATAERMKEVAKIAMSFPDQNPALVLSAMGKTTNDLLLAGCQALEMDPEEQQLDSLARNLQGYQQDIRNTSYDKLVCGENDYMCTLERIRLLHVETCDELGVDTKIITPLLSDLERILLGIALMRELSPRTKDLLVSFGERLSTRIMAAYMNDTLKVPAKQYDSWELGVISTDEFTNADVDPEAIFPDIKAALTNEPGETFHIPVITGFLAKGATTGAITTLGRGGSDLSATLVGAALGLDEVQVWKDVDGILTTDPRKAPKAVPVPFLTFEEATELAFFGATVLHPQAMRPARIVDMPVRVKNSYNITAPGTLITGERDMTDVLLTSIVLKNHITLVDVVSERKLGFIGFASSVFTTLRDLSISTDVVATSEASITASLDPAQLWSRDLNSTELDQMKVQLEKNCRASVKILREKAIVSLIGNVNRSSEILQTVFTLLSKNDVQVDMISQGASKVNISLVVDADEAEDVVRILHKEFFEQ